jgi:hypothetical protein
MKPPVYDMIHHAERGWWYRGRTAAVRAMINRAGMLPRGKALDYGAGYGAMREIFAGYTSVDAVEVYPEARLSCANRGYDKLFATAEEMLCSPDQYGCVGAFDVIEHIEHDSAFLADVMSKLEPGGVFIGTVPAHQFLFGPYDEAAKHFRRYEKGPLQKQLAAAGYLVRSISYWNMLLFPVAALSRLFRIEAGGSLSPPPIADTVLGWIVLAEALWLRSFALPMGLSIVFIAQKPPSTPIPPGR